MIGIHVQEFGTVQANTLTAIIQDTLYIVRCSDITG